EVAKGLQSGAVGRAQGRAKLPRGVRELIGRRLDTLSEECARTLDYAAVVGREFDVPTLVRVAGDRESVLDALDEAIAARVLADVPDALGRFRFAHALIRESLYDGLPPTRRMRLHADVGRALETVYESSLDAHLAELAHHFYEAAPTGEAEKAAAYAVRAGRRSPAGLALREAAR